MAGDFRRGSGEGAGGFAAGHGSWVTQQQAAKRERRKVDGGAKGAATGCRLSRWLFAVFGWSVGFRVVVKAVLGWC